MTDMQVLKGLLFNDTHSLADVKARFTALEEAVDRLNRHNELIGRLDSIDSKLTMMIEEGR